MAIPDYQSLYYPFLKNLKDCQEHSIRGTIDVLAREFNLTDEELKELLPNGRQTKFDNRVRWAQTRLKKSNLLESTGWGKFRITALGLEILKCEPSDFNDKFIMDFSGTGMDDAYNKENGQKGSNGKSSQTPEEILEASYQELRRELAQDLLEKIMKCSPEFFENLVVDLLVSMGYGGSRKDAGQAVGKSGDGGIDGIIKEDKLGLDVVYIQAKRWSTNTVGRPDVQAFLGSLAGLSARKGVFITTSKFSREAREYVNTISSKVILIDGEELAQLMIDYDVGVTSTVTYKVKKPDLDYFGEE